MPNSVLYMENWHPKDVSEKYRPYSDVRLRRCSIGLPGWELPPQITLAPVGNRASVGQAANPNSCAANARNAKQRGVRAERANNTLGVRAKKLSSANWLR